MSTLNRSRVLVVHSKADVAEALQHGLEDRYTVQSASDPTQALHAVERLQPNLVLLHMTRPNDPAIQLLEHLSGLGEEAPALLLAGCTGEEPELEPFRALIALGLPWPCGLTELRAEVSRALERRKRQETRPVVDGNPSVLLADADLQARTALAVGLRNAGVHVMEASGLEEAMHLLAAVKFDAVFADWALPGGLAGALVEGVQSLPWVPPIAVATRNTLPQFVRRVLARGVADVLPKPLSADLVLITLERMLFRDRKGQQAPQRASEPAAGTHQEGRRKPGAAPRIRADLRYTIDDIVGISPAITRAKSALRQVARMESTVLFTGETGSGKEMFAQAAHWLSARRDGPFVAVNAAAIPETLLEAELFGYSTGAFTGAKRDGHRGKFQMAAGGTLFLDEIGDLPLALQAKLLRVLQEGEIDPVGGQGPQRIDVRLVAATHQELGQMVRSGSFRSDLYFRLNVVNISIPSLRERREDIPVLATEFMCELCKRYGVEQKRFAPESLEAFAAYSWPGNIRELRNAVEQAFVFTPGALINPADLPPEVTLPDLAEGRPAVPHLTLADTERESIQRALMETRGNKARAAKLLGISRAGLYVKLRVYGLG